MPVTQLAPLTTRFLPLRSLSLSSLMEGLQTTEPASSLAADQQFHLVANSLAQLLETATRELARDREAAKASLLGGLASSGWQTAALSLRLLADAFLNKIASMGGLGFSDLKWKKPVMVGDTIGGTATIAGLRRSRHHPERDRQQERGQERPLQRERRRSLRQQRCELGRIGRGWRWRCSAAHDHRQQGYEPEDQGDRRHEQRRGYWSI